MPIPGKRVRVGGSGYTTFSWDNGSGSKVIAFAQSVQVQSITPVATAQPIQPLDSTSVIEIVTPGAASNGVLTLTLTELYNQSIWERLAGLSGSQNIIDIMQYIATLPNGITITRTIIPPVGIGSGPYSEAFYGCVVASVEDNETIDITTMSINKTMEVWFTSSVKNY
jgi:hypothetical protein